MPLKLLLILSVAASLSFQWSEVRAQPLISETSTSEVQSPPSADRPVAPLRKERVIHESVIKEEDLKEDRSMVSPLGSSPGESPLEMGVELYDPGTPEMALPQEPVSESEEPAELQLGRETVTEETEISEYIGVSETEPPSVPSDYDTSLIAKITPQTTPRRAASLRLTDEGRKLVDSGEYQKALQRLEKTIAIDSTNPYSYYYLALVHHRMANHEASANFLDVAESLLSREPLWLAQVFALKGRNFQAQGSLEQADASYAEALKLDPNNRTAFEALTRIIVNSEDRF